MPLNYRRGGVTYQINLYDADTDWENSLKLRQSGATKYAELTTNVYHEDLTHMKVRDGGVTYGVLAQRDNLEIWTWGYNGYGNLGVGDTVNRSSPVQVGGLSQWVAARTSWEEGNNLNYTVFAGAIKSDGSLWTWGGNQEGELGHGNWTSISSPQQVGSLTDWRQVATGDGCMFATKTDGTLWAWGDNQWGQLAQGDQGVDRTSPIQVGTDTDWKVVEAGGASTCAAIRTDGSLWTWGNNYAGQLGHEDSGNPDTSRSSPTQVGTLTDWDKIAVANTYWMCAIKTDGTLWAWGFNDYGNLGLGDTVRYSSPVQVGTAENWKEISCGFRESMGITTDGKLWAWGYNHRGQLGQGDLVSRSTPTQIGSNTDWYKIGAGNYLGIATTTGGTLWSWGDNGLGGLAQGDLVSRSTPTQIGTDTGWRDVSTRRSGFTFVRKEA